MFPRLGYARRSRSLSRSGQNTWGIWSLMLSQATQISGNSLSRMHDQMHCRRDCLYACCYRSRRTQGWCNVLSGAVLRAWVFVLQDLLTSKTDMTKGLHGPLNGCERSKSHDRIAGCCRCDSTTMGTRFPHCMNGGPTTLLRTFGLLATLGLLSSSLR